MSPIDRAWLGLPLTHGENRRKKIKIADQRSFFAKVVKSDQVLRYF